MLDSGLEIIKEEKKAQNSKIEKGEEKICKICLCEENDEKEDPMITACVCKGYSGAIHLLCLREWLNSKRKVNKHSQF